MNTDDLERYVPASIDELNLKFQIPHWWKSRVDREGKSRTWVYWDVYTGTLRISGFTVESAKFKLEDYLKGMLKDEKANGAKWKTYGGRRFVYYEQDGSDETRLHFYISGHGKRVLVVSFAYLLSLLDDEFSADEVQGSLEDVERVLSNFTFGSR